MNLHGLVTGAIGTVNPFVLATWQQSTGYTVNANFQQVPTYTSSTIAVQVQALTNKDLRQIDGLNLNGTVRAIYANGSIQGTVRPNIQGGDLITLSDGPNVGTWLVNQVLETWPDWCKVVATLQNGS